VGLAQTGDTITYTFNTSLGPYLGYYGWDGSPRAVTAVFSVQGGDSIVEILDTDGSLVPLGTVDLGAKYSNALQFTGSSMTASGATLTVVLGTPGPGTRNTISLPTTMTWSSYSGSVTESGLPDVEF
jgi:hypothetical protein